MLAMFRSSALSAVLILGVLALAVFAVPALARRPANVSQRARITFAEQGRGFPARCGKVWISTVDSTWASWQFLNAPGCESYGSDGIGILHVERHRWIQVTAGSAFRCPIQSYPGQPHVPNRVAHDLIRYIQC
jgi:hypothetical protein